MEDAKGRGVRGPLPATANEPPRPPGSRGASPFHGAPWRAVAAHGVRYATGLAVGALTALAELLVAVLAGVLLLSVLAWPRARRALHRPLSALAVRATRAELRRLARWLDAPTPAGYAHEQAVRYALARIPLGLLGGVTLSCAAVAFFWILVPLAGWIVAPIEYPLEAVSTGVLGLFLLFLAAQGVYGTVRLEAGLARHLLGQDPNAALELRIAELATSRADVVTAVDDERRRIERDLHDGVQQHLVALGMLLGRARRSRDPERADQLFRQAHEESRRALVELREVAWRVYPTVLDEAGLRVALETVAERTPLPVDLAFGPDPGAAPGDGAARPLARQVETAAYFVVSEAVTNVVKHSGATRIAVDVRQDDALLRLSVTDDGTGGADPAGGGLTGLASRVAALDGRFRVHSPTGGPTTITAELPCA
ncbi:sensor histidine kinase [Streptomyces sp. NPDC048057]|uniref:sensor histidine kinase n=1 Tax=Streptomyces sp. NPDC048057 TaxID=3155628 RepID=UPI003408CBC1